MPEVLTHSRQRCTRGFGTLAVMRNLSVLGRIDRQRQVVSFVAFVFAHQADQDRIQTRVLSRRIFAFSRLLLDLRAGVALVHVLTDRVSVVGEAECACASVLDLPGDVE